MENPGTWTLAEHVVNKAINDHFTDRNQGLIGLSVVRRITDALRAEKLLVEDDN